MKIAQSIAGHVSKWISLFTLVLCWARFVQASAILQDNLVPHHKPPLCKYKPRHLSVTPDKCTDTCPVWQTFPHQLYTKTRERELLKTKSNIWHHCSKIFFSLYQSEPCQTNPLQLSGLWRSCSKPC